MPSFRQVVSLMVLTLGGAPALATGTMRCATHVVDQGTTRAEIVKICGQPTVRKDNDAYWYYDQGDSLLVKRLFFVDDEVEFIEDVPKDEM